MDVVSLLRKMRVPFKDVTVSGEAETTTEHPKIFSKIHIVYSIIGDNLDKSKVEKAIKLSQERYCGVTAMLKKSSEVTHSYHIEKEKQGE